MNYIPFGDYDIGQAGDIGLRYLLTDVIINRREISSVGAGRFLGDQWASAK
jgi:hypothetical protein